ncbi:MAG: efflux RND transporter periplasmic adaptor subunit [Verrucomicrobia bacterium]|nr:efflux RND transporter periplasmic adaptor subunit [Verrucomicrobiota bacterium]
MSPAYRTKLLRQACPPAVALCILATACKQTTQAPPPAPPPPVTVATPTRKEIVEWDEYTGRTAAVESVQIRPRVSGYIDKISFKAGQMVQPGDLLFVIDPRPYQSALDQATANLKDAEANRELQQANFARADQLFQNKVTSKQEFDTSVAQKNQAEAKTGQARAQAASDQLNLDFTQVKAPVAGRLSRPLVTLGNLVQADSTELTTLVSVDPIYAYFNVDERAVQKYIGQIKRGERQDPRVNIAIPVYLQLEGEGGFPHEGITDFFDNTYNAATGTLQVRASFRNEDGFLWPNAFVRVRIAGTPKHGALLITDRAVGTDQGQKFVLVVDQDNVVHARPVELGPVVEGMRVVRTGLGPDDRVVINGLVNARPGQKVTAQPGDMTRFLGGQSAPAVSVNPGVQPREGQGNAPANASGSSAAPDRAANAQNAAGR